MVGTAISVGGSLLSGAMGSSASKSAAGAQTAAANRAAELQKQEYDQTRTDLMPWMNTGVQASNTLGYLMGLGPAPGSSGTTTTSSPSTNGSSASTVGGMGGGPYFMTGQHNPTGTSISPYHLSADGSQVLSDADNQPLDDLSLKRAVQSGNVSRYGPGFGANANASGNTSTNASTVDGAFGSLAKPFGAFDFAQDPGYQFRMDQGNQALTNYLSAKGNLLSGAGIKAVTNYNQDYASGEYANSYNRYNTNQSNLFSRLSALSGAGQNSAAKVGDAGMTYANNAGNLMTQAGNAQAAGIVGSSNAISQGISGAMYNPYTLGSMFGQSQYGGGVNVGQTSGMTYGPINWN